MQFSFEVGEQEKHVVSFEFNQMLGNVSIKVDDREVASDFRLLSLSLVKSYEFVVGTHERHAVRIEKRRKLFLAGFRPQKYRVFVDGRLVAEHEGM